MLLDIVILPPKSVREKVGRLALALIRGFGKIFVVDGKRLIPHLRASPGRMKKVIKEVAELSFKHKASNIKSQGLYAHGSFLGMNLSANPELKRLNQNAVRGLYKLRTGRMPWLFVRKARGEEKKNIKKYGVCLNIGKTFRPHFTLAGLKNQNDARLILARKAKFSTNFKAETLAVCEVNSWYQVTRVIKEFKLYS